MNHTSRAPFARNLPRAIIAAVGLGSLITLSACAAEDQEASQPEQDTITLNTDTSPENAPAETETGTGDGAAEYSATVNNAEGENLGVAEFSEEADGVVRVELELTGLEPGFHGVHLHEVGKCETDSAAPDDPENTGDFLSAGSHIQVGDTEHPDHAGDLPQLLVQESGEAVLSFETDRLSQVDLTAGEGTALIIHSDPDNYANIPERYTAEGADEDSRGAGDAGSRQACGVIEAAS